MPFNFGVLIYAVLLVAALIWCIYSLYKGTNVRSIRWSFLLAVLLSGIPFIGESLWIPIIITSALAIYLWKAPRLPIRILGLAALSVLVMFVGYSSYALLLIRSSANPPMNQTAPDNVFNLGSYLNREQYGENPLFYGQSFKSEIVYEMDEAGYFTPKVTHGKTLYSKAVSDSTDIADRYVATGEKISYNWEPKMLFPRMYSSSPGHPQGYLEWIGAEEDDLPYVQEIGRAHV